MSGLVPCLFCGAEVTIESTVGARPDVAHALPVCEKWGAWIAKSGGTRGEANVVRTGGPDICERPCGECDADHHFSEGGLAMADEEPEHEAAKLGILAWYGCKHCPAWREWTDNMDEEDDDA